MTPRPKNKWWQVTGLDIFFMVLVIAIFLYFDFANVAGGWIKALVFVFPVLMIYWIVGRIVQGRDDPPRGV